MLQFNDFCEVLEDVVPTNEGQGLEKGSLIFVAGTQVVPISEDLYTQRVFILAMPVIDERVHSGLMLLVDPAKLKKVAKGKQKRLSKKLEKQFEELEKEDETIN